MLFKKKSDRQKDYYKTTALYDALVTIKDILANHQFVLMVAVALVVSIGILISPFVYRTLHWYESEKKDKYKTTSESIEDTEFIEYIYVTVSGEVKAPGMYKMTTDDRVNDAIIKAGGFTENAYTENINLAQSLTDEQYINIMSKAEIDYNQSETYIISEFNGIVNINTGTLQELCQLPGIGEATALKIIEYRELTGGYKDIRDIQNVNGIGPSKYNKIKNNITI